MPRRTIRNEHTHMHIHISINSGGKIEMTIEDHSSTGKNELQLVECLFGDSCVVGIFYHPSRREG